MLRELNRSTTTLKRDAQKFELAQVTVAPADVASDGDIQTSPIQAFPEGGSRGWLTLIGSTLVVFVTAAYTLSFGVYEDYYVRVFLTESSTSEIGWIGSVQICLLFGMGIVTGKAFDSGYFYHLMVSGFLLQAFSHFMLSLAHPNRYYQVILAHLGGALAHGLVYVPSISVVAHYFQKHRPLAMGVVASGIALGGVVHTILLNQLLNGPIGFANGVRISQALNSFLFGIAILIMRTRLPPTKTGTSAFPFVRYISDPPYLYLLFSTSLQVLGLFMPAFYLQLYGISQGLNKQVMFYCLATLNAVSAIGRILPSILAPKLGVYNLGIAAIGLSGVAALCMPLIKSIAGIIIYAAMYGFLSGATVALGFPMFAVLADDITELGSRIGIGFFVVGFPCLVSTPILGAILTDEFHWWRVAIFSGVTLIIASAFAVISRMYLAKRKESPWI